jgi:hypothetical protein
MQSIHVVIIGVGLAANLWLWAPPVDLNTYPKCVVDRTFDEPTPTPGFLSMLVAIEKFCIKVPSEVKSIAYGGSMGYAGLYRRNAAKREAYVVIGRDAFRSWGQLGGTLVHELEAHATQWTMMGGLVDALLPGTPGNTYLEKQAYRYEISQAERLGLTPQEIASTKFIMEYLYGKD